MKAKSLKGNSTDEIKTALAQSMADGFKPTLAFVFISIKQDIEAVRNLLQENNIQIFGATTGGEFIDGDISTGSIAILLLDMDPSCFLIMLEDYRDKDHEAIVKEMAKRAKAKFKNPSLILTCSIDVPSEKSNALGEPLLRAIESVVGSDAVIWGGRAGDDLVFNETIVFNHHQSLKRGILMMALDGDKISVQGRSASGQKPIGTERTITKAINNWVYEIDNQPAAEMVLKFLGINLTQEEAETYYPRMNITLSVSRDKGDPVLRGTSLFNWKDKSFMILGSIKEGDKIRLTVEPGFEVIEEVKKNAERLSQGEMQGAEAMVMFSCVGRLWQFGPMVGDEIEGVRKAFDVPMAGLFTYGEFGRIKNGNNEFHNNTCCWVTLKEK
jgi:hypothetical protein